MLHNQALTVKEDSLLSGETVSDSNRGTGQEGGRRVGGGRVGGRLEGGGRKGGIVS